MRPPSQRKGISRLPRLRPAPSLPGQVECPRPTPTPAPSRPGQPRSTAMATAHPLTSPRANVTRHMTTLPGSARLPALPAVLRASHYISQHASREAAARWSGAAPRGTLGAVCGAGSAAVGRRAGRGSGPSEQPVVAERPTRCGALRAGGRAEGRAARRALREGHAVTGSK